MFRQCNPRCRHCSSKPSSPTMLSFSRAHLQIMSLLPSTIFTTTKNDDKDCISSGFPSPTPPQFTVPSSRGPSCLPRVTVTTTANFSLPCKFHLSITFYPLRQPRDLFACPYYPPSLTSSPRFSMLVLSDCLFAAFFRFFLPISLLFSFLCVGR